MISVQTKENRMAKSIFAETVNPNAKGFAITMNSLKNKDWRVYKPHLCGPKRGGYKSASAANVLPVLSQQSPAEGSVNLIWLKLTHGKPLEGQLTQESEFAPVAAKSRKQSECAIAPDVSLCPLATGDGKKPQSLVASTSVSATAQSGMSVLPHMAVTSVNAVAKRNQDFLRLTMLTTTALNIGRRLMAYMGDRKYTGGFEGMDTRKAFRSFVSTAILGDNSTAAFVRTSN